MSKIVDTQFGRARLVTDGGSKWWLWECPKCHSWRPMTDEEANGDKVVVCQGPSDLSGCDYAEAHEFGKWLYAAIAAMKLMGYVPYYEEGGNRYRPSAGGGDDGQL